MQACLCMWVYTDVWICLCMYTCTRVVYTRECMFIYPYVCVFVYSHVLWLCVYACTWANMYVHVCVCVCVCMCMWVGAYKLHVYRGSVCMCMDMCEYVCTCMRIDNVHTRVHTCIHVDG